MTDREEYLQKICAAVAARADQDFFVAARTDALAAVGLNEAIARVEAAREAGADAVSLKLLDRSNTWSRLGGGRPNRSWRT